MMGTEHAVPARYSREWQRQQHYHDEVRDRARTSTTTLLEGNVGTQECGCYPQLGQTSDPSYITTEVLLNPNKPRFISKVSLLSNTTMPHSLPASFGVHWGFDYMASRGVPYSLN